MKTLNINILCVIIGVFFVSLICTANPLTVSGRVSKISQKISPDTAAYPDCNFTFELTNNEKKYVVTAPLFERRISGAFSGLKRGDQVKISIIPIENADAKIRERQCIDDLADFENQMYYATGLYGISREPLFIDSIVAENWRKKLLRECLAQMELYNRNPIVAENYRKEFAKTPNNVFLGKNYEDGYFWIPNGSTYVFTDHYNPTLLTALLDLNERCKKFHTTLLVIPSICEQEYNRQRLLKSANQLPFVDYGRMSLIADCLKNGIIALDTNAIIKSKRSAKYLPFSMMGDSHYTEMTNFYIADEIAKNLLIQGNSYTITFGHFSLSSMHIPYYKGPTLVQLRPSFAISENFCNNGDSEIIVAGDSFATYGNLNRSLSGLTLRKVLTIPRSARSPVALEEFLQGKYDNLLKHSPLVCFIFCAPYMQGNYPTQELVDLQKAIVEKRIHSVSVPLKSPCVAVAKIPAGFRNKHGAKVIITASSSQGSYKILVNGKIKSEYCCNFRHAMNIPVVLNLRKEDFNEDGLAILEIKGNCSFSKVMLADCSD